MSNIFYFNEKNQLEMKIKLYKFCKDYEKNKLKIIDNKGGVYSSKFLFYYNFIANKSFENKPWRSFLIEYFTKCETLYPGSSFLLAKYISGYQKNIISTNNSSRNFDFFKKYINNISSYGEDFLSILKFSGPESSIKLETTNGNKTTISKKTTSKFYLSNNNLTASMFFKNQNKIKRTVRCVVIDGFIEKESEIFLLLEKSFEEKRLPVIICRGVSDNILKFISSFISRNKFPVLIYDNKIDNLDPFSFSDFAKLGNSLQVSMDTADDIRYDCYEKSFILENCILSRDYIEFRPDSCFSKNLVKEIEIQKEKIYDQESIEYLNKRKKRCGINFVEIYVPNLEKQKLQEFKFLIQCYNSIAKFGMIKNNNIIYGRQEIDVVNKLYEKFNTLLNNVTIILEKKQE